MRYIFSIPDLLSRYIDVEINVENIIGDKIYFQLPAWRPGRYELGNFARNIQRWNAYDSRGNELPFKKITKDQWVVETKGCHEINVRYNYYAAQLDAGGCWLDSFQLYINPIHCCMYVKEKKDEACEVLLDIPAGWNIAGSLKALGANRFSASGFDELVDSPFIASPSLKHHSYNSRGKEFHIWIQGECQPDFTRIEKDFNAFTEVQTNTMGDIPCSEYHFLVQVLPYKFYHGVEHLNSTVLAIGPGNELMTEQYSEFVGVASHELFHAWNVKTIRPAEMMPYDYTKENYSRLGYVYEGFTTYYGDLFLARTGFFNTGQYLNEISIRLQKHMDNYGRFNYSVAQSSFDTWLDGYVPGIPNRKTSIYDEGSLVALMLDFQIRNATGSEKSLDDVMRTLYRDFGKKKKGYTEKDIVSICEAVSGTNLKAFFDTHVYKATSYHALLGELLSLAGMEIVKSASIKSNEHKFGFRLGPGNKVMAIYPGSPAERAGMIRDDEIISVDGKTTEDLANLFDADKVTVEILTLKKARILNLETTHESFFDNYKITLKKQITDKETEFLKKWLSGN